MAQKKLQRFAELKTFSNVLENPPNMKSGWNIFFKNNHPITLELACGKGEYAVGLGRLYPQRNFIGIDIKGNRMWVGAKTALQDGLQNVAFLRTQIEKLTDYFAKGEVSEIWLTFPDPQLKVNRAKKRLTHPRFLRLYQTIMGHNGIVHLKTDSPDLYHFTKLVIQLFDLELVNDVDHVHANEPVSDELKIQTHYEKLDIAQSNRIHYLTFIVNKDLPITKDEELKKILGENEVN